MSSLVNHPKINRIAFQRLSFGFPERGNLLEDVDFEFPLNQVVQVRGPQGSGISSLLRVLAGTLEPTSGHYYINHFSVHELTLNEFKPYLVSIGYGFDHGGLISNRSLIQNLALPMEFHGEMLRQESQIRAEEYMARFGILQYRDLRPALASGGTRKAACLARAFMMRPSVMILDNPTQGLNRSSTDTLIETIKLHQREYGLMHIFAGTEDEYFLRSFDYCTVELHRYGLRLAA